tara:strand:+ start:9426 stop:10775 length:1350 start_codon:yes stop_codon:yes gene_type:complete
MIKLICFDLDGVLIEAKKIHYEALNSALEKKYQISWEEHLAKYDGLKTNDKLNLLHKEKKLSKLEFQKIWENKQLNTINQIKKINKSDSIFSVFKMISPDYKIAICSNSIKRTVLTSLSKLQIIEYVDLIISNEDVKVSKPHPEIYWKAMSFFGVLPEETIIFEDSPVGLKSAHDSGAHVKRIKSTSDINTHNINQSINNLNMKEKTPKWKDKNLNILIPMAGAGTRFQKAGYTFPKPLIEIDGKPMIQLVIENLNVEANFIFVVQKEHREKYNLDSLLKIITKNPKIVEVDGLTEGAACTALLAKDYIDNDKPLFFANSDQYVEWNSNEFFYKMNETPRDGSIVTFKATHPKWSFAKIDKNNLVTEVAEKNPISDNATVGFYYWNKGSDFVKYAEEMIRKNDRVNNEFYVCPVFNHAISDNKKIMAYEIQKMYGLGTPEDLKYYLKSK